MVILYNEDHQAKLLKRRMEQHGGKDHASDADKKSGGPARRGGGRLVDDSDKIQAGDVEDFNNPLFTSQKGVSGASGGLNADAILQQRDPPTGALWSLFREEFAAINSALKASQAQLAEAKKANAAAADRDDDIDAGVRMKKASKKGFNPIAAPSEGASSAALSLKSRVASRRGAGQAAADDV